MTVTRCTSTKDSSERGRMVLPVTFHYLGDEAIFAGLVQRTHQYDNSIGHVLDLLGAGCQLPAVGACPPPDCFSIGRLGPCDMQKAVSDCRQVLCIAHESFQLVSFISGRLFVVELFFDLVADSGRWPPPVIIESCGNGKPGERLVCVSQNQFEVSVGNGQLPQSHQ